MSITWTIANGNNALADRVAAEVEAFLLLGWDYTEEIVCSGEWFCSGYFAFER